MTQQTNVAPNGVGMKEVWNRFRTHQMSPKSTTESFGDMGGDTMWKIEAYSCHESLTTWFVQDPHNEEQVVATRTTSCVVFSCG
jgi:hypothetical protein